MLIEKDIIYIKLAKSPLAIEGNTKSSTDSGEIYHETESLVKVNAQLLMKAFSNKMRFIPCNRAFGILFDVKHPFVAHYILPWSRGNQSLSTVPNESIMFFLHRLNPLGILESLVTMQGSGIVGIMAVIPYFELGLWMEFLERVCMG